MSKTPPAPELVEAYRLLKAGERRAAGQLVQDYLAQHKSDAQGWWLMAHACTDPAHIEKCLENVLKIEPDHARARARLDQLRGMPDDEPDDSFFFGPAAATAATVETAAVHESAPLPQPSPAPQAAPPPAPPVNAPVTDAPSFEEFAASVDAAVDPFTPAQPADDPFAGIPDTAPARSYNPFDTANRFDPRAAVKLATASTAQVAGTGNQPEWGPGLAFVQDGAITPDRPAPPRPTGQAAVLPEDHTAPTRKKVTPESLLGFAIIGVAMVVLLGLVAYVAVNGTGGGDSSVPRMAQLDGGSFLIDYPKDWHRECKSEPLGYTVCGVANHSLYNEVDYYSGHDVNLGEALGEMLAIGLGGGDLPDHRVSIIVMDVPRHSPSYDNGSMAKTMYEWYQNGWLWLSEKAEVTYNREDITVDGYPGYYYEFISEDPGVRGGGRDASYDIYVEHDSIILWMKVSISSSLDDKNYHKTIQAMIDSIDIKPVEEW